MFMKLIGTKQACGWTAIPLLAVLCLLGTNSCSARFDGLIDQEDLTSRESAQTANDSELVIQNDSPLPDTYPLANYELRFRGRGGVVPLHWKVEKGTLPPGLKLEEDGLLHGRPERAGEFQFTLSLRDSGSQRAVQKGFVLRVVSALTLNWKKEAHVNGNRIDGSVDVSNTTPDDIDLTFIVLAVPSNGRAVAIGYQHFPLPRGTVDMELPFGETLPRGGYVVHVDVIGEIAAKNVIHRQRLQTPSALQVSVGP
jgi:Putative Ig domain